LTVNSNWLDIISPVGTA